MFWTLIIDPGNIQSSQKLGVILAVLANMALCNPTKEGLDHHEYSLPLIELLLTNSILTTKYVLERENYFSTFCRPEKQEMSINSDEIFEK